MRVYQLWSFLLVLSISAAAQDVPNKAYPLEPATLSAGTVPEGEVLKFSFDHSKLYPGTHRSYWVYIPKEYSPGKPACLYVCMDGILFSAPTVFDYLISKGEMPVTIGVFISSGAIMKDDTTVLRYNRTNEFDNMNDRFVRFIEEEILPDVMRQKTTDGRQIFLSPGANDHAIAGASSGAICAFTAAWQRPDLFSRVFSAIGTYIGMRGGDQYPVLIRKTEPKALRIYLQDNNNDTWNPLFGNWFKANIDMEAALNFAGYEVTNMWQEGGHDDRQATAIFADAMRWLWKGWPEPVRQGWSANNMLTTILDSGQSWHPAEEKFFQNKIVSPSDESVVLPGGTAYILKNGTIFYQARGRTMVADKDDELGTAMAISPDKAQLVVTSKHSHWLYDYVIQPDGALTDKQTLYWLHNPGNDDTDAINSLAFDADGDLFAATNLGIQVCDQNGRVRAILSVPGGPVTALWFGGSRLNILFAACGNRVFQRTLRVTGAPSSGKFVLPKSEGGG